MLIGRIVETHCACGFKGELSFLHREKWERSCPAGCGATLRPGQKNSDAFTFKFGGNRRFAGSESESVTEGFHPAEVGKARRMFSDVATIRDDGGVHFDDRACQKKFVRRLAEMQGPSED